MEGELLIIAPANEAAVFLLQSFDGYPKGKGQGLYLSRSRKGVKVERQGHASLGCPRRYLGRTEMNVEAPGL